MTVQEIKTAVDNNEKAYYQSGLYEVIKDKKGQYLIKCSANGHCAGLTYADGETLNGKEEDFFKF